MKNLIRKKILETRNKMTAADAENCSSLILDRLIESRLLQDASHIMVYLSFKKEVITDPIISYSLGQNKSIYVPICIPETHEIVISRITGFEDLYTGFYGIREPKQSGIRICDSSILDLVLVPGVAFDSSGNRIGFGGGYYDRFMKRLPPGTKKVALAYSFQVVENIPASEYDMAVDYIATEKEILHCNKLL